MLFNHLERLKIIFNQLGLLCQFKELLMRVKFVNSLWAAFFCVYVVEGHAEMGGGRYQKGCSRSCYYIIISYLHEAHTFSVYLWVHQEFNCYNLLSTIHELSQAESLAAQNRESQNFFFFFKYPNWEMRKGRSFAICKAAIIPTFTSSLPCESFSHFFPFLAKQYHLLSVAPRWQTSPYLGTHTPFPKSYSSYPSLLPWSSFPLCQRLKVLASFRFLFNFII